MLKINYKLILILLIGSEAINGQVPAAGNQTGNANSNMNWILISGYDASGNILSQDKNFYDNNGNPLQSQSKVFYRSNPSTVYTHVLATQPLYDVYSRKVALTLPAPINYADFSYNSGFAIDANATPYTYKNFDRFNPSGSSESDKTNSPDPVGGQSTIGTVGWYYGTGNTWEPYTATSSYPYSRSSVYKDGTNKTKKQANAGESFVMGSGHETSGAAAPISGELANYLQIRNKYFTTSQVGMLPTTLSAQATQSIRKDANGNELLSISDGDGHILMTARPGTDLAISNAVSVANVPASYTQQLTSITGSNITIQSVTGGNNATIYLVSATGTITSAYTGTFSGIPLNSSLGSGTLVVLSDVAFSMSYTSNAVAYSAGSLLDPGGSINSIGYFKVFANNTPVTISGSYSLYDMNTEAATSLSGGQLPKGYYKIVSNSGIVNVSYSNGFTDVNYNFYNQLGQLVANIAPNGVKLLYGSGINNYATLASVPFVTMYTYDAQGRMVNVTSPDAGTSHYVYRKDGKIRFSQSTYQASINRFSYTNYDPLGRLIECGEYSGPIVFNPDPSVASTMQSILEDVSATGGLTASGGGNQYNVVHTTYDVVDNSYGAPLSTTYGYAQDPANLGGAVSFTSKYSQVANFAYNAAYLISQTWYNYDEEGKVVWRIKYIASLGASGYKTTDYTYDALSRMVKRIFQKNTAAETFVHYFQYDPANGNLWYVYTNTVDNPATEILQAKYVYYLHGGLKRIELGGNLQGIDYTYTLQGNLKGINNSAGTAATDPGGDGVSPSTFSPDVFGEVLDYYVGDYNNARTTGIQKIYGVNNNSTTDSWVGNIKAMSWFSSKTGLGGGSSAPTTYLFSYDQKYQLTGSTWGTITNFSSNPAPYATTTFNQENVIVPNSGTPGTPAYDLNGNIQYLQRTNTTGASSDLLAYAYPPNSNKVSGITNTGSNAPPSYSYSYDQLGREISEATGTAATTKYTQYDVTGKVLLITTDAAFNNPVAKFVYDEMGDRIEKISYNASYQPILATYYFGDAIYTQAITNGVYGTLTAKEYIISGNSTRLGTYYTAGSLYTYELRDHLGNTRAVIAKTGAMYMANDYYPFGMVIATYGTTGYRYGYQGQTAEADGETGWNNFELRMYNPRTARWMNVDPKGQFASPYVGMGNNPVNGIDPDGGTFSDWLAAEWFAFWHPDSQMGYSDDKINGKSYYTVSYNRTDDDGVSIDVNVRRFEDHPTSAGVPFHYQPWVGNTITAKTISGEYTAMDNNYGKLKYTAYHAKVIAGTEGILATFNTTMAGKKVESYDMQAGFQTLSLNLDEKSISAGITAGGVEVHQSILQLNPLSKSGGASYTKDGNIVGADLSFEARPGTYVVVAGVVLIVLSDGTLAPVVASGAKWIETLPEFQLSPVLLH